jgi:hypothetical protein
MLPTSRSSLLPAPCLLPAQGAQAPYIRELLLREREKKKRKKEKKNERKKKSILTYLKYIIYIYIYI